MSTTWKEHVLKHQVAHRVSFKEALQGASKTWKNPPALYRGSAALTYEKKAGFSAGLYGDILITMTLNTKRAFTAAAAAERKRQKKVTRKRRSDDEDDDDLSTGLQLPASLSVTLLDDHKSTAEHGVKLLTQIPVENGKNATRRPVLEATSSSKGIVFKTVDFRQTQEMDLRLTMKFVSNLPAADNETILRDVTINISVDGDDVTFDVIGQMPLPALGAKKLFEKAKRLTKISPLHKQ
jgi:ATP-dependent Clp protease adapter protein ClpS